MILEFLKHIRSAILKTGKNPLDYVIYLPDFMYEELEARLRPGPRFSPPHRRYGDTVAVAGLLVRQYLGKGGDILIKETVY